MKSIHIESENPEHHWNHLDVDGEIVLDLGCGKHLVEDDWLTTPEYFLSKGATFLIGVDPHEEDIKWYQANVAQQKSGFFVDFIDSARKIETYINHNGITSLKMDIEWKEEFFMKTTSNFPSLKHIAVETHSRELFHDMIFKLLDLGFDIDYIGTFYPRVFKICNMIYATRK